MSTDILRDKRDVAIQSAPPLYLLTSPPGHRETATSLVLSNFRDATSED
jgi:hypothetical protein